jgi:hypothetical protein
LLSAKLNTIMPAVRVATIVSLTCGKSNPPEPWLKSSTEPTVTESFALPIEICAFAWIGRSVLCPISKQIIVNSVIPDVIRTNTGVIADLIRPDDDVIAEQIRTGDDVIAGLTRNPIRILL